MSSAIQNGGVKQWSRLRTRMAVSYVGVTLVIVLLLEALFFTAIFLIFARSPILGYFAMERGGRAAEVYALQAAVYAEGSALNPDTTFQPGQAVSLSLQEENDPPELSYLNLEVPYLEPGAAPPARPVFALLVDPGERVLASSYPDRYPAGTNVAQALPEELGLIRESLAGKSNGALKDTPQGRVATVAQTVRSRDKQPLGAVVIQMPAGGAHDESLLNQLMGILLPSSVFWLCLTLPIGALFGVLTTRGLIRRIERLAGATARFKQGDYSQRVPVSRADEIGQLEQQFNLMAEDLVAGFEQRQALAEESARREERARIEQELSSARYIQQSLLPESVPPIPGWQIESFYRPAREVGGDLYDFLPLPGGRIGIVIGDVTGKGMPAALMMANTCAMLRAAAPGATSPGEVLALVNDLLHAHIPPGMFATCFYAVLDPASGRLCYANAGHDVPYLARPGEILELRATGMPLGLMPGQTYLEEEMTLSKGDCILFHSDGLVEAHAPDREMFGFPRLKQLMLEHACNGGLIEFLLDRLQEFTGQDWEQEDDITLIVLKKS